MRQQWSGRLPKAILFRGAPHLPTCRFLCRGLKEPPPLLGGGGFRRSLTKEVSMNRLGEQQVDARRRVTAARQKSAASDRLRSELEQVTSSVPGEVAKRWQCPAWRIAAAALDDRRFRRKVRVRTFNRHTTQALCTNLNFGGSPIWSTGLARIGRSNVGAVKNVLPPLVNFHDGSSHGGDEN